MSVYLCAIWLRSLSLLKDYEKSLIKWIKYVSFIPIDNLNRREIPSWTVNIKLPNVKHWTYCGAEFEILNLCQGYAHIMQSKCKRAYYVRHSFSSVFEITLGSITRNAKFVTHTLGSKPESTQIARSPVVQNGSALLNWNFPYLCSHHKFAFQI